MTDREQLDRLLEDFHEWNQFPCNKPGNLQSADRTRAKFVTRMADLRAKINAPQSTAGADNS